MNSICGICHEAYGSDHRPTVFSCGHTYGSTCVEIYLKSRRDKELSEECPKCKKIIQFKIINYDFEEFIEQSNNQAPESNNQDSAKKTSLVATPTLLPPAQEKIPVQISTPSNSNFSLQAQAVFLENKEQLYSNWSFKTGADRDESKANSKEKMVMSALNNFYNTWNEGEPYLLNSLRLSETSVNLLLEFRIPLNLLLKTRKFYSTKHLPVQARVLAWFYLLTLTAVSAHQNSENEKITASIIDAFLNLPSADNKEIQIKGLVELVSQIEQNSNICLTQYCLKLLLPILQLSHIEFLEGLKQATLYVRTQKELEGWKVFIHALANPENIPAINLYRPAFDFLYLDQKFQLQIDGLFEQCIDHLLDQTLPSIRCEQSCHLFLHPQARWNDAPIDKWIDKFLKPFLKKARIEICSERYGDRESVYYKTAFKADIAIIIMTPELSTTLALDYDDFGEIGLRTRKKYLMDRGQGRPNMHKFEQTYVINMGQSKDSNFPLFKKYTITDLEDLVPKLLSLADSILGTNFDVSANVQQTFKDSCARLMSGEEVAEHLFEPSISWKMLVGSHANLQRINYGPTETPQTQKLSTNAYALS